MSEGYFIEEMTDSDYSDLKIGNSLFTSIKWLNLFRNCYHISYKKIVDDDGKYIASFAVLNHEFNKKISLLPFCDYADFENINLSNIEFILSTLQKNYTDYEIIFKSTFSKEQLPKTLQVQEHYVNHIIHLDNEVEVKTKASFRSKVNKAKKHKLVSRRNYKKSAIDTFYEMYTNLRLVKFKSIPQPKSFFYEVWSEYMHIKKGFTMEILHEDKVIASALVLEHENVLYYKYSCSKIEYLHKAPNNFLIHSLTEFARDNDFQSINLGLSDFEPNEGLKRFKESCGGTQYPLSYIKYGTSSLRNKVNDDNDLLKKLSNTIVSGNMDIKTISALSEHIYPYFA